MNVSLEELQDRLRGYFETPEEASKAYLTAKEKYHSTWENNA